MNINSIRNQFGHNYGHNLKTKDAEIAKKLGLSVQQFQQLPETEKKAKVEAYNQAHPNDKIEDKQYIPVPQVQGSSMNSFMNDIDWKKLRLER